MNRRDLFKQMTGLVVVAAVPADENFLTEELPAPEPLPDVPPDLPYILTADIVIREFLFQLGQLATLRFVKHVVPREYSPKQGDQCSLSRLGFKDALLDRRKHVSFSFKTQDLTLSLDDYSDMYIRPAAIAFAHSMTDNVLEYEMSGEPRVFCAELALPNHVPFTARASFNGMCARVATEYDIDTDETIMRLDMLYGFTEKA